MSHDAEPAVAYLTGQFPRITDTWIRREMAGLKRRRLDVSAFSVRRPDPADTADTDHATTYLLDLARSPRLVTSHLRLAFAHPARYAAALALAWRTRRRGPTGAAYQAFYFAEAGLLADELTRRGIDHLHNHLADSSCTVAMLASALSNVPFSFTIHGSAIFFEPYTWRLDEKIRRAAFVATISNFTRSQAALFADAADYHKLHIVHCGVEPHRYGPANGGGATHADLPDTGIADTDTADADADTDGPDEATTGALEQPSSCQLVFVGRVVAAKGIGVLLNAFSILRERRADAVPGRTVPELHLTVVGDGPERTRIEHEAERLCVASQVSFVGRRNQQEVAEHLADADIFVLPSFSEGLPVVLMEAMAAEVPVIATGIAGVPELVVDGESGLIVPPSDVQALADAIEWLATDPVLRSEFGAAGRKKVQAEFDSDIEAGRLAQLIQASKRQQAGSTLVTDQPVDGGVIDGSGHR